MTWGFGCPEVQEAPRRLKLGSLEPQGFKLEAWFNLNFGGCPWGPEGMRFDLAGGPRRSKVIQMCFDMVAHFGLYLRPGVS